MWKVEKGTLPYRQAQTLEGMAAGKTNKQMANEAGVSINAIGQSIYSLVFRMGLPHARRSQIVAEGIKRGWLTLSTDAVVLLIVSVIVTQMATADLDIRRSSTRLATRVVRQVRTGRSRQFEFDGLVINQDVA